MKKRLDSAISEVMALRQKLKLSIEEKNSIKHDLELCQIDRNELSCKLKHVIDSLKKGENENQNLIESIVYLERDLAQSKNQSKVLSSKLELKQIEFGNVNKDVKQKNDAIDSLLKQAQFYIKQKESDSAKLNILQKEINTWVGKVDDVSKELINSKNNEASFKNHCIKMELSVKNMLSEKLLL